MKNPIHDPCRLTLEAIEGYVAAFPCQVRRVGCQALVRADAPIPGKVSVIAGGGFGQEPVFMGYIGSGMADGCAVGSVVAPPCPETVLEATRAAFGGAGVLYLCGNGPENAKNFDLAAEEAAEEGIRSETIRADLAGGFLILKAAGARAEEGATLEEVYAAAGKANGRTWSLKIGPHSCVHGGVADEITGDRMARILDDLSFQHGDEAAVLVNGLGSTPLAGLYIVFRRVACLLADAGIGIHRSFVGEYGTALDTPGASVTLMRLDDELRRLVDAPAACPCFVQP